MLTLEMNVWYVRWFQQSCQIIGAFWYLNCNKREMFLERNKKTTDLCSFFWILFFGVLISAFTCLTYSSPVLVFLLALHYYPFWTILHTLGLVLLIFGSTTAFFGFLFGLVWVCDSFRKWANTKVHKVINYPFPQLIKQRYQSWKDQVCIPIKFN